MTQLAPSQRVVLTWTLRRATSSPAWPIPRASMSICSVLGNYSPAPGLRPFAGDSVDGSAGFTLHATTRLKLEPSYLYSRLRDRDSAASVFHNHLARWKLNYQFTRRLSLRAILDYEGLLPNASLVDEERAKGISGDMLFTHLVNPGTALYVGYTGRYDNLALEGLREPMLRRTGFPGTPTGRQFFVKWSHLLRF